MTFDIRITPTTDIVQFEKTIRCLEPKISSSTCSCFQAVDGGGRVWLGTGVHPEVHRPDPHVNRYLSQIHKYTNTQTHKYKVHQPSRQQVFVTNTQTHEYRVHQTSRQQVFVTNTQIQSSPTLTSTGLPSKAHNFHRSKLSFRQRPMILGTLL